MARLADSTDFNGGLYDPPYHEYPFFAERAETIVSRLAPTGTVLVAGCGWGYLVTHLRARGVDAWGFDASQWAVDNVDPDAAAYCLFADVTGGRSTINQMKSFCGMKNNDLWDLIVTEDVLPCLDDSEATTFVEAIRPETGALLHILSPLEPTTTQEPGLNWKTGPEWRTLIGAGDHIWLAGGLIEVP